MARRLIGLDIGTNAVTSPRSPPATRRASTCSRRSRCGARPCAKARSPTTPPSPKPSAACATEVGLKKVPVRVGLASPRVVVRQVEMPRDDARRARRARCSSRPRELIPIPIDDAVLDFAILGPASPGDGGEPRMQVLLVAVHEATVLRLVAAVEAGGLAGRRGRPRPARAHPRARSPARARARRRRRGATPAAGGVAVADDGAGRRRHRLVRRRRHRDRGARGRRPAVRARARQRWPRAHRRDRDRPRRPAGDRGGAEACSSANPAPDEMVARAAHVGRPPAVGAARRGPQLDRLLPQPARLGAAACASSSPAVRRSSRACPSACRRSSACRSSPRTCTSSLRIGDIGFATDELPRLEPYLPARRSASRSAARASAPSSTCCRARGATPSSKRRPQIAPKRRSRPALRSSWLLGGVTYLAHRASRARSRSSASGRGADHASCSSQLDHAAAGRSTGRRQITALQAEPARRCSRPDVAWPTMIAEHHARTSRRASSLTSFTGPAHHPARRCAAPAPTPTDGTELERLGSSATTTTTTVPPAPPPPTITGPITFHGHGEGLPDARQPGSTRWARSPQIATSTSRAR